MRDWLGDRLKRDAGENISGLRARAAEILQHCKYSWEFLTNPARASESIVFGDRENYHHFLDITYRGILYSLVIFSLISFLSGILTGEDLGPYEFLILFCLGLLFAIGALVGYAGLLVGLKLWKRPSAYTDHRLLHLYAAWAGPIIVMNYIIGSAVLFVGAMVSDGSSNPLYSLYQFGLAILGYYCLSHLMHDKFGYRWHETVISHLVGTFGILLAVGVAFTVLLSPIL